MAVAGGTLQSLAVTLPGTTFITVSAALAFFALTPAPALIPVIALLATVRLSTWVFSPRAGGSSKAVLQAAVIAFASAAAHLAPSVEALSSPNIAVVIISVATFFASAFAVALVFLGYTLARSRGSHWSRLTIFPALWASGWGSMSSVSPLGQLITWSPVHGLGPYEWIRPIFGQWGIDWVAAAWAVVLSEVLGDWIVGTPNADNDTNVLADSAPLLQDDSDVPAYGTVFAPKPTTSQNSQSLARSRSVLVLAGLLALFMIPSYTMPTMPLPVTPSMHTTPISVACALPGPRESGDNPTLNDFIEATAQLHSRNTVILWPENAVRFQSPAEKEEAFAWIQGTTPGNKYIGVSFEEHVPSEDKDSKGKSYNSFALLSRSEVLFEYRKRNLVPVAESMSLTPGHEVPQIVTLNLTKPSEWKGPGWSQTGSTRPVTLTASICLDFASASSFTALPSRPALILAPARTWHESVGRAMWEQAQARAAESGATVLWCDGGRGGLSGLASARHSEIVQVGPSSWSMPVGLPYPLDTRRTWYMAGGQGAAAAAVWAVALVGLLVEGGVAAVNVGQALAAVRRVLETLRRRKGPAEGNLIDV